MTENVIVDNSTQSNKPKHHHLFDIGYALAFVLFSIEYVVNTLWNASYNVNFLQTEFFKIVVVIALILQILRMYYVLKTFEFEILFDGENHFLEALPKEHQKKEKIIRLALTAILIIFTKLPFGEYVPSLTLACCFILLIWWDFIVWSGFENSTSADENVINSTKKFYYISDSISKLNELNRKRYKKELKFWERILGIIASGFAISFAIFPSQIVLAYIFSIISLVVIILALIGTHTNRQTATDSPVDFSTPIFMPFFTIFATLNNENMTTKTKEAISNWRRKTIVFLILIASLFVGYHWFIDRKKETKLIPIKIATSKNLWCSLTIIALDKHYFEQEGLEPTVNYQAAGRLNMDALIGGTVDFANVVETNIAYQALSGQKDLLIHGRIVSANDYAILTNQESKIYNPSDFQIKSISYAQATGAESFVFWFLEKNDLLDKNIKLIPLQPAGLVDNFLVNNTDAVATWEPFVSTIQKRKEDLGTIFRADSLGFKGIMTVATKSSWAEKNQNIIQSYNNAMIKASKFIKDSTSVAQNILFKETGIPLEIIQDSWERFNYDYVIKMDKEKMLIGQVIHRIKFMIPDKKNVLEENINNYFKQ